MAACEYKSEFITQCNTFASSRVNVLERLVVVLHTKQCQTRRHLFMKYTFKLCDELNFKRKSRIPDSTVPLNQLNVCSKIGTVARHTCIKLAFVRNHIFDAPDGICQTDSPLAVIPPVSPAPCWGLLCSVLYCFTV